MSSRVVRLAIAVVALLVVLLALLAWRASRAPDVPAKFACTTALAAPWPEVVEGDPIETVLTEPVVAVDFPTSVATSPIDDTLFVTERAGRVLAIGDGDLSATPILDLRDEVTLGGERGLLSVVVAPDGRHVYVSFTDAAGHLVVDSYPLDAGGAPVEAGRRPILVVEQPHQWHNGGTMVFGPDGFLYIGLGDGGSEYGDPDPDDHGQRLDTLLGSILRIEPTPDGPEPYTVPIDNPFVDDPDARSEIWVHGVRNAWRFAFDAVTDELWVADVGHGCYEEVNVLPAGAGGANLGWSRTEGVHAFQGQLPGGITYPTYVYERVSGDAGRGARCAVIGGEVSRGDALPELDGGYVFGDYCEGVLRVLWRSDEGVRVHELDADAGTVVSFAAAADGELYVVTDDAVRRLVSAG